MICSLSNDEQIRIIIPIFLVPLTFLCILIVYDKFDEPQKLKEKCVEIGIGKFIADNKGNVKFYFINHNKELIEYEKKEQDKKD